MAGYQSIFSGPAPTKSNPLSVGFTPGQYGKVNAQIAAKSKFLNSVNDVPTLNAALKSGQISSNDWTQRFNQLKAAQSPSTPPKQGLIGSLGHALNNIIVKPAEGAIKSVPGTIKSTVNAAGQIGPDAAIIGANVINKTTGRAPVTAQQLKDIKTSNVGHSAKTFGATGSKKQLAGDVAQTGLLLASPEADALGEKVAGKIAGKFVPEAATKIGGRTIANTATGYGFGASGAAAQGANLKQINKAGIQNAELGGGLTLGGSALAKGIDISKVARGKDEATNALINSQKIANAGKQANLADKLGSSSVKDATTPKPTSIPVAGESKTVAGKVIPKPADTAYIKASNKLSDQYEKELANVQSVPHPVTQKVLQDKLDTKYNALQQQLDDSYGKSSISFKGNSTAVKPPSVTGPRSALAQDASTPFDSTRIPEQKTNELPSPAPTKTTSPTGVEQKTGEIQVEQGTKVSGSALNSEQRAVEKGLVKEFPDKATYSGTSYKQDAEDAVKLAHESPEEAQAIASGNKSGRSQAYNVAVRRAVESKANKENDIDTIMQLGNSSGHTRTSEAAQTLGAESFNAHANSPVEAIKQVAAIRKEVGAKKLGKSPVKAIASTVKEIKSEPTLKVSRQDWHSFVSDLRCK